MITFNTKNVKGSPKSTIAGIVLCLASIVSVYVVDGLYWSDAIVPLGIGLALLGLGNQNKEQ